MQNSSTMGYWVGLAPKDCRGPISILKRLFAIGEIPINVDLQVCDSGRSISLIESNLETVLLFLKRFNQDMSLKMIQKRSDGKSITTIDFDWHVNWSRYYLSSSSLCNNTLTGGVMSRAFIKKSWGTDDDDKMPILWTDWYIKHRFMTCPATEKYRLHMSQKNIESIVWYFPFPIRQIDDQWEDIWQKGWRSNRRQHIHLHQKNNMWIWTDGSAIQYSKANDAGYA